MKRLGLVLWLCLGLAALGQQPLEVLPIVGPVTRDTAELWFQTREPGSVELVCLGAGTDPILADVSTDHDGIGHLRLEGLRPGTRYEVRVTRPRNWLPITFQTQPERPGSFTFAFGSCCYVNDPGIARGENGGEYHVFTALAAEHPDLMLWLGDNVYYRPGDWDGEEAMRARWRADRWRLDAWWPVLAGMANYAIWDDHDFGPNDAESSFPLRDVALRVFRAEWPEMPYVEGTYYKFRWQDVEFFMLDDRFWRSGSAGVMLGREQMEWLRQGLLDSDASFKVVVGGSQMLNPVAPYEAWALFPEERASFLKWLVAERVPGVLFLSGDRHSTELIRIDGAYPLYDFTSSPLTSSLHQLTPEEEGNPFRVAGSFYAAKRNYGLGRVSGPEGDRVLTLECKSSDGELVWSRTLRQRELR